MRGSPLVLADSLPPHVILTISYVSMLEICSPPLVVEALGVNLVGERACLAESTSIDQPM